MALAQSVLGGVTADEVAEGEEPEGAEFLVGDDFLKIGVAVRVRADVAQYGIAEGHAVSVIGNAVVL